MENINIDNIDTIDHITIQKMLFIFNALNGGWTVKKKQKKYFFTKKHEGKHEIFLESYLKRFIRENLKYTFLDSTT